MADFDRLIERQWEVARRAADGMSNKEIARALGLTTQRVRNDMVIIYKKLGLHGRIELVVEMHAFLRRYGHV